MGLTCLVMADDPFQVSVRADVRRQTPDASPEKTEGQMLSVQVDVPPHHKLYADKFRVEVPSPVRLIPRALPVPG